MDLVHDQLATGKKLRVLTVVDTFSRYVPVLVPCHSYRGEDVVHTLGRVRTKLAIRRRFLLIKGSNLCLAILIYGPTPRALS